MKRQKNFIFFFFLLAGIVFGSLLANLAEGSRILSWLAYEQSIGIGVDSPFVLDLSVIRLALGLEMRINIAQILCIMLSLVLYHLYGKRI